MARSIDRFLELFRREKLRDRSLKLKLRECACFVFVDFSLRKRRVANNVCKQLERLVQVLNQPARANRARQRRQARVCSESRAECINLLRDVFTGARLRSFPQQRCGEAREAVIVRLVSKTTTQHHELHVEGRHFVRRKQDDLQSILQRRFFSARKFYFQNFFVNGRFAFDHRALRGLLSWTTLRTSLAKRQRRHEPDQDQCDDNVGLNLHHSHCFNSFTVLKRRWRAWPSPSAW